MIELNRLKAILDKLSKEEKRKIKKNLIYGVEKTEVTNNYQRIFNLLETKRDIDAEDIQDFIYGRANKTAFKKHLQRLTEKILESLINKDLLNDNDIYDRKSKEVFNIKRKLLYYDVLAAHGVTNFALLVLNQAINAAIKIEYYDYLIIALDKKLIKMSLRHGVEKFIKINNEIKHYSDCNISLKNSQYKLRLYAANYEYKKNVFSNNDINLSIEKIQQDFKRTKSKSIQIYLYYIKGIYYFNNFKYLECRNNFKQLYTYLIRNNNIVFNSYLVNCLLNIAECETMLYNFELSLGYLIKLIGQYTKNEFNYKLVKEMIFINYFYSGDLTKSLEYSNALIDISSLDNVSLFLHAKRYFYLASLQTIFGNYLFSNKLLVNCHPLEKDKEGWNVGIRILSIINNIELGKLIFVESQIENLRKHVLRVKERNDFYYRFNIISNVLVKLTNNSFNFSLVYSKYINEFVKLNSWGTKYSWILKSPEMILFHEWFDAKVKGIPYDHTEVMKRLRKMNKSRD